jgi:hypothetical protein
MRTDRTRPHRPLLRSVLTPLLLVLGALACDETLGLDDVVLSEPFEYEQDAAGRTYYRVVGVNGDITVTGIEGDRLRATGTRSVRNCSESQAEPWLEELEVRVSTTADEVLVETVQPQDTGPCTLVVEYELAVPSRLVGRIVNVNGDVAVGGRLRVESVRQVNGNVVLAGTTGSTEVLVTNGTIDAGVELSGADVVDLRTVNGGVELVIPTETSATLSAAVVNGAIRVTGLTLTDRVATRTTLTGTLGDGEGEIVLRTTNGGIEVTGT